MNRTKNVYGLSRDIPTNIKRQVRQRDGFGCVFCAVPIIEYEHVDPTFAQAKEHEVSGITLLCPTCHAKVTKKQISKALVKEAMKKPAAMEKGHVGDQLFFSNSHPTIVVGGATFTECDIPIKFQDYDIISIREENGKYFLNANLWDNKGRQSLKIIDNEWNVSRENIWDLTIVGNTVTIHEKKRSPTLVFKIVDNKIFRIVRLDMIIGNHRIVANENYLNLNGNRFFCCSVHQCVIGVHLR